MRKLSIILIVCTLLLQSCKEQHNDPGKNVFRYNEAANITTLDPAFARDQAIIWATNQLFNGLVQLDDHLEVKPCIARSWEISPDGLVLTFHLRRDVFFHDNRVFPGNKGRRVVAGDFVYSFNRIADKRTASPGSWVFNMVEEKEGLISFIEQDDSTFVIHLKKPFPPFLGILTMQYCSVVPREAVAFYGNEFRRNPVGTGPFIFKMWKEGVKLVMVRNPGYFEFSDSSRLPFLDAVAVTFQPDKQSAFLEFIKGKLDFMSGIDPTYKDEVLDRDGHLKTKFTDRIYLITQPYLNTEYLGVNVDSLSEGGGGNPLLNKELRKAISYAFDREKMIHFLRNNIGTPGVFGIIPEGLPSFDSLHPYYDYDPVASRLMISKAGFSEGNGIPSITLTSTPDYLDICKYLQHQLAEQGIEMNIEISPPASVKELKAQAKLSFFRASWIADYPDAENYLSMFYSKNFCPQGPNYTHFSDREFDRLYEEAMSVVDDSLRCKLYRKMEMIIMEQAPVIILYYDQVLRFVQKNVTGIGSNPMNLLILKNVRKL
ncbi:MAG: ABC transporter substrate-binding protein [bacterium]